MKRRTFLKSLLGIVGTAVLGIPKVQAEELKTSEKAVEILKDEPQGDVTVVNRGFVYTYSRNAYREMIHRLEVRKKIYGIGNSESLRVYCATKIVRLSDGKVFKDRYPKISGVSYASPEEFGELYHTIAGQKTKLYK